MKNQQLKEAGLKITTPRLKILNLFEQWPERHVSAEDVYKHLQQSGDEIALATIYRVLTQFEEAGLIVRHKFEDGYSVFELNEGHHHDHLICVKCRKVIEFVDEIIEVQQEAIAKKHHFTITDHSLNIYGLCESCQKA